MAGPTLAWSANIRFISLLCRDVAHGEVMYPCRRCTGTLPPLPRLVCIASSAAHVMRPHHVHIPSACLPLST
jgi:hypothetical protein